MTSLEIAGYAFLAVAIAAIIAKRRSLKLNSAFWVAAWLALGAWASSGQN